MFYPRNAGYAAGVNAGIAALDLTSLDAVLVLNALVAYKSIADLNANRRWLLHTREMMSEAAQLQAAACSVG